MNNTLHSRQDRPARGSRFGRAIFLPAVLAFLALAIAAPSCASPENRTIVLAGTPDAGLSPPAFTTDAAQSIPAPESLTKYCPTTSCPVPLTTCPASQHPCDVNLMTDPLNCGSCGFKCEGSNNAVFDCVAGRCTFKCAETSAGPTADCNGVIDDDCEVTIGTNDNCSACGDRCTDPKKPCIYDEVTKTARCGCAPGLLYCGDRCIDPMIDDENCSACSNVCDPSLQAGVMPDHTYYGCLNSQCGAMKCEKHWDNCDKDPANGCEASLTTNEHCGACNSACAPGQTCRRNPTTQAPECVCPPGEVLCGTSCVNLKTDPRNCGSCETSCLFLGENKNRVGICNYGSCIAECKQGWGDCNGDPTDGCEVNLNSDQRNCGACGKACDARAGQPCIAGQCAVHPCGEGEEEAR